MVPNMDGRPVLIFFLRVLAWLPLTFAVWYYFSILLTRPIAWAIDGLLPNLFSPVIADIRQNGYQLTILAKITSPAGTLGLLRFDINTLLYSNCLPLYTALVLASPGREVQKWGHWMIGLILLWLVAIFGVSLEILKYLIVEIPESSGEFAFPSWLINGLVLTDLYTNLLLPALSSLVIWIALNLNYIKQLTQRIEP